jgi:hypothetical protein
MYTMPSVPSMASTIALNVTECSEALTIAAAITM